MRKTLIVLQIVLISSLAVLGALASAEDKPTCPLGNTAQQLSCDV